MPKLAPTNTTSPDIQLPSKPAHPYTITPLYAPLVPPKYGMTITTSIHSITNSDSTPHELLTEPTLAYLKIQTLPKVLMYAYPQLTNLSNIYHKPPLPDNSCWSLKMITNCLICNQCHQLHVCVCH